MKAYRKPGPEEAMVRELEACLTKASREPLTQARPLLDALDRRSGGTPFDPAAGWEALQGKRSVRRRRRLPLALAAALLLLTLAACGTVMVLSRPAAEEPPREQYLYPPLAEFFQADNTQTDLILPLTHQPKASARAGSLTVRVLQTVQDTAAAYVLFSLELPEDETFPENVSSLSTHVIGTDPIDAPAGGCTGYSRIVEQSPHRLLVLHDLIGSGLETMEGPVKLWFPVDVKVWYDGDKHCKTFSRKPLVLRWEAPPVQAVRTWTPDAPIQDAALSKVLLSPLSVAFTLDGEDTSTAPPIPVTLTFRDGTVWEVSNREAGGDLGTTLNDGSGRLRRVYYYRFDHPLDLDTVAELRVGGFHQTFGETAGR